MSRADLIRMTKVEVVVSGADAQLIRNLFRAAGATGYTTISGVSGLGHHGEHQGRLLFNQQAALEMLITVIPDEKLDALLAEIRPLLARSAGVMFVSDTYVIRPEHFE